jgi:hypothetical protein
MMNRTVRALMAGTLLLAVLLASSCDNDFGVLKSVLDEKQQIGTTVFRKTAATGVFKLGSYYYASTAMLYRRSTDSTATAWAPVSIAGLSSYTLRSVVLVGSSIYALVGASASDTKLYQSSDADTWNEIDITQKKLPSPTVANSVFALDALYSAGGNLYVEGNLSTYTGAAVYDHSYTLYYFDAPNSAFSPVASFDGISSPICDVVSNDTYYWFGSANMLYRGTKANGSDADSIIGIYTDLSTKTIWDISYSGGHLYITTPTGYLYQDETPAGYNPLSKTLPLTKVIEVPSSSGDIILVGTDTISVDADAEGYYEGGISSLVLGSTSYIVSKTAAIFSTTVSTFPVHSFYYDPDLKNLFVCISPGTTSANYYGLYESSWDGSSWSGWKAQ